MDFLESEIKRCEESIEEYKATKNYYTTYGREIRFLEGRIDGLRSGIIYLEEAKKMGKYND